MLNEHPFLSHEGVVKVFTRQGEDGELKLAAGNVPQTEKKAFTTIANLYDMVRMLSFDLDPSMRTQGARPTDDVLEASYGIIQTRLDSLIKAAGGDIEKKLLSGTSARDIRLPKGHEADGNALMRPVIQKAVARVVCQIAEQDVLSWDSIVTRLQGLDWRIGQAPWIAVFNPENAKMITGKENSELLNELIYVHLAAQSKQAIARARKNFKVVRNSTYPLSDDQLAANLTPHVPRPTTLTPDLVPADVADTTAAVDTPESDGTGNM